MVLQRLCSALADLDLSLKNVDEDSATIEASKISWTRQAKRRKLRGGAENSSTGLLLRCLVSFSTSDEGESVEVKLEWRAGKDRTAVESLWDHISRHVL